MPAFAMPSRAFLTVVAFTLAFVLASASPLRRIPALEQTAVRPRGRAASSICTSSAECMNTPPANANRYCDSGVCSWRCKTGYIASGSSCVKTASSTNLSSSTKRTSSATSAYDSVARGHEQAVNLDIGSSVGADPRELLSFERLLRPGSTGQLERVLRKREVYISTTPALSSTVSASVYTWNPTPTRTYSTAPTPPAATPVLIRRYRSGDFFDTEQFSYFNLTDPTDGLVTYLTAPDALTQGLATLNPDGTARLGADRTSTLAAGQNRSSVRISSIAAYDPGTLLLFDLAHVPVGCGVWPALWMYSDPWPTMGEIDILEGVNERTYNQLTIHTLSGCNRNKSIPMTGSWVYSKDSCDTATGSSCSVQDNDPTSFGEGFNQAGGGVFAVQMAETGISIWHWPRSKIPSDVAAGEPRPQTWGYPVAAWDGSTCDTRTYFSQLWITLNIDVCGRMAAKSATWKSSTASGPTCAAKYATCADAAADPAAFKEAYFDVNYIKVFSV
ncbi:hypothetical protein JCM11641_002842 [Rhodosporidiobolus odoratus]